VRFSYDQEADALAISVRDDRLVARTIQVDQGTLVDVDENGVAVVIEVLRPARSWPIDEIIEQYGIDEDDAHVLRSMWEANGRYPFVAAELQPA